jgi:transcriptional regulator with XRE-family HTH domain
MTRMPRRPERGPVDNLARALTILRVARGWNQTQLAARAGMHYSAISTYECGKKVPLYQTLVRVLAALGYPDGALDRTRQFLAALDATEEVPAPPDAPLQATQLARDVGRAAERFALAFLEIQAGGWRRPL